MISQEEAFTTVKKGQTAIDPSMALSDYLMQGMVILQFLIYLYLIYIFLTLIVPYFKLRIRQLKRDIANDE